MISCVEMSTGRRPRRSETLPTTGPKMKVRNEEKELIRAMKVTTLAVSPFTRFR